MKQIKTTFHNNLSNWEHLLAEYKKSYPKNFGALTREYLPGFMMLFGVMMFINSFTDSVALVQQAPCFISPALFVFGLLLYIKKYKTTDTTQTSEATMQQCISEAEATYSNYPDVMEYLRQYRASVAAVTKRKKNIKRYFLIAFWGFFVVYGATIALQFVHNYDNKLRNVATQDNICRILELEDDVPFLTLTPYTTDIADGIKLETKSLDIFLYSQYESETSGGFDLREFTARKPKISGGSGKFRLIITDENGNFIHRCPYFVFDTTDDNEVILSGFLQYYSEVLRENSLQTIETLRYLKDNQEHLRFIVEKKQ